MGYPPKLTPQGHFTAACGLHLQIRIVHLLKHFLYSLLLRTINRRSTCVHSWQYGLSHNTGHRQDDSMASEVPVQRKSSIEAGGMNSLKQEGLYSIN